jgi:hypothetical protein
MRPANPLAVKGEDHTSVLILVFRGHLPGPLKQESYIRALASNRAYTETKETGSTRGNVKESGEEKVGGVWKSWL